MIGNATGRDWKNRTLGIRLGLVYGGFFLFLGMFVPYWPVWLEDSGYGLTAIGVLVALTHGLKVVTSPVIGHISDKSGSRRRVLLVIGAFAVFSFALYFGATGFVAVALVTGLSHVFIPALLPLTEQFTVMSVRRHGVDYGRVRAAGSVTFILASLAGGFLLERYASDMVLPFCLGALMATFLAILLLPDERRRPHPAGEAAPTFAPVSGLLKDRWFLAILIMVGFLQTSHGVYFALGTVHWINEGLDPGWIGVLWSIAVVAEIVLFVAAGRLIASLRPVTVFAVVGILGALRWTITAITVEPAFLILAQCLHAATYGATHLATMAFLGRYVPEDHAASAQALVSAGPMGLGLGLVLAGSGVFYDAMGGKAYFLMAALCAAGTAFALATTRREERPVSG